MKFREFMMNPDDLKTADLKEILNRLDSLEERITRLESNKEQINQVQAFPGKETEEDSDSVNLNFSQSSPFETNLGEYGLAWLGSIVLFFAVTFLWQYFNDSGKPLISFIVGIISVAGVFTMSHYFRKNFSYLSFVFNLFGFIILYYIILRLHYYNIKPIVTNQLFATILLLMMIGVQLYSAVKKQSQALAGLAFTFALITAFVCKQSQPFFLISITTTGLVMYSFWKYNWWKALIFILCISFLINLIWLFQNSVSSVKISADLTYHFAFIYFSITTAIYSLVALRKPNKSYPGNLILLTILLAGSAYSILMFALVMRYFPNAYVPFFTAISIYCIAYSVLLKFYSQWKFAPAFYALFGFIAISVTIYGNYHFPDSFLLLICQSFLVLALALWYRSQIITLMNTFLLLILVIAYYNISGTLQAVNFSIPAVALFSARIINWQKERLNIKTDFIRNIYLFTLFFSILYATYKGLPGQYIIVSWLFIAGIYVVLSIIVKSFKYRWMAMANLIVAAFYLFLIDLASIDLIYRIIIFLFFAITSIVISVYYVNKLKKKNVDIKIEQTYTIEEIL
ncbi:MAG: hypothetical protein NTY07_02640 [Bacteroidia bacterium]|nr:hypothetical protein [Bacteroidia bacterium]